MDDRAYIPSTATLVRITNVVDPFHLRIYDIESYTAKLVGLERKLHQLAKTNLPEYEDNSRPAIGDLVFIDNRNSSNIDLPAWCCRGIVGSEETANSKYRVFLPDHGIALEFWAKELKSVSFDSISDEFLTSTVGIGDILPVTLEGSVVHVSEYWNATAVQFTREIISSATQTYFDHLTSDKLGNKFGEIYLVLDEEVVTLSEALFCNQYAIIINENLMQMIEDPNTFGLRSSAEIKEIISDNHESMGEYVNRAIAKENQSSEKPTKERAKGRSTAVYVRAFDVSLNRNRLTDLDHEILVHSKVQCEQLTSVTEARFPAQIHRVLCSLSIKRPMRLQSYVWPAITRGFNVVAVASQKCGKTFSYLVPVISSVTRNETLTKVPRVNGPLALILCETSLDAHEIHQICKKLLQSYPRVNVLSAYNGISEQSIVANIYNGCEILVSTPSYLARLIRADRKLLNFTQLSHIIFDGADVILEKYQESLSEILKILSIAQNGQNGWPRRKSSQIITIARHWTRFLKIFVNGFLEDPYICIGSYMEAAVYAALKPKLIFLPKIKKTAKVVELLDVRWSMIKTIIVCTTTKEATELVEVLKLNSIDTLIVHDETIFTVIREVRETWMTRVSGKYFVLVCTDQVLSDLNIKDADWLIHYSLSSGTKSQFFYRFSTLTANFYRHVRVKEKSRPGFIMMADEGNDVQLNGVVNVMQRLHAKIPPLMEAYLKEISISTEMAKTDRRLCENIKAFGRCPKKDFCSNRHIFVPEVDQPTTAIRTGDWVKLVLTGRHSRSANRYSARIIEHTTAIRDERVPFSFREFADLSVKMQKYYANPANRRSSKTANVGNVCAIEEAPGTYKRVKVLSAVDKDTVNGQCVDVRCIDDGDVYLIKACQLLEIPDELAQWPSHIVDIYLTGIAPFDDEPTWSPCTENVVGEWFQENLVHSTSYIYGKVLLHLSHILWVDPLEVRHKLQDGYPDLVDSSLKTTLIKAKCAMENKEHIANLFNLCRISNITI